MGERKHTEGPFVAEQSEQGHYEVLAPAAPKSKRRVARLGGPDREANAFLFAAAPDMLAALKSLRLCLDLFEASDKKPTDALFLMVEQPQIWREAKAAIAKAEGRT